MYCVVRAQVDYIIDRIAPRWLTLYDSVGWMLLGFTFLGLVSCCTQAWMERESERELNKCVHVTARACVWRVGAVHALVVRGEG